MSAIQGTRHSYAMIMVFAKTLNAELVQFIRAKLHSILSTEGVKGEQATGKNEVLIYTKKLMQAIIKVSVNGHESAPDQARKIVRDSVRVWKNSKERECQRKPEKLHLL